MNIDPAGADDAASISALAESHPFARLRAIRRFGFDVGGKELALDLADAAADPAAIMLLGRSNGEVVACAAVEPRPFETEVFGFLTGRLSEIVVAGSSTVERVRRATDLLEAVGSSWADSGGRLIIGDIDTDDHATIMAAQSVGFRVVEASTTYFADNDDVPPHRQRDHGFLIRQHSADEAAAIPGRSLAELERWVAHSYSHGHLHADPLLPSGAADAFYSAWTRNTFRGDYGDIVYTAWRDDEVVGFLSWLRRPGFVERHGVDLLAPGLGAAIDPIGRGAFGDMYATVTTDRPLNARLVEHSTQLSNFAVHSAYARFPVLQLAETHFVVHGWFGG